MVTPGAPEVGSTANHYEILAKLAQGGMAEIYLARSVGLISRHVVLKRISRDHANDPTFVRMFLDEARLAAQLQHPNIAQVYDVGKLGESYFFAMEYVHGETVRTLLHRSQALHIPIPVDCALTIVAGAAAGLHHAHEKHGHDGRPLNIIHRDVSPSNLMVTYDGHVKVVDFGVAKAANRIEETRAGTVKGKISYLSPEQCQFVEIDRRSDLYSLGIVMWELLTVERLYRRDTDFANMTAIVAEHTPPPSSRRAGISPQIDAVVGKLLAKSPADRYQTADDLYQAIEHAAASSGAMLSVSSLSRLLRELFGKRPEPWIELQTRDLPAQVITVTGEPLPSSLGHARPDMLDARLASVADLTSTTPVSSSSKLRQKLTPPQPAPVVPPPLASGAIATPTAPRKALPTWFGIAIGVALVCTVALVWMLTRSFSSSTVTSAPQADASTQVVAAAQVDAAPIATAPPIDAAVAAAPDARPVEIVSPSRHTRPKPESVASLYKQRRFPELLKMCRSVRVSSDTASPCTLAACNGGEASDARRWFAVIPANRRATVASECKANGVRVEAPPAVDCKANPFACQH